MTANGVGTCGADDNQAQAGHLVLAALTARGGKGVDSDGNGIIVQPLALRGREGGAELEAGPAGSPANALRTGTGGASTSTLVCVTGQTTHTLTAEGADASEDGTSRGTPIVSLAVAGDYSTSENVAQTVRAANDGQGYPAVSYDTVVRRLTPLECERLQGFPDDWTEGQSDAQRYRQMGNSLAVPVVEWIARRIIEVDEELS